MKIEKLLFIGLLLWSYQPAEDQTIEEQPKSKPKVSFTFDDGITTDILHYPFEDWNEMILASLRKEKLTAAFFVTGRNKQDAKGRFLLDSWSKESGSYEELLRYPAEDSRYGIPKMKAMGLQIQ